MPTFSSISGALRGLHASPQNRILRIFRPTTEAVTEGGRNLNNGLIYHLYTSPDIIMVFKWKKMRVSGYATSMSKMRNA
jgi:hypothetical protein